jgi:hypothetical protein
LFAFGQGTFVNLNFESANLPVLSPGQQGGLVPVSAALPGWQAFLGSSSQTEVWYNTATISSDAVVWIVGPNFQFWNPIQGNFTVALRGGSGGTGFVPASLSQTGLVPSTTKSLQAKIVAASEDFVFSLGGVTIPMHALSIGPDYTLYGGEVSAFAGQTAELRITAPSIPSDPFYGFRLDSIVFSPNQIPEPSTVGLFVLGALFLTWRWRRNRTR